MIGSAFKMFGSERMISDMLVADAPLACKPSRRWDAVMLHDNALQSMNANEKRIFPPCPVYALPTAKSWLEKGLERCMPKVSRPKKSGVEQHSPPVAGAPPDDDDSSDSDGSRACV